MSFFRRASADYVRFSKYDDDITSDQTYQVTNQQESPSPALGPSSPIPASTIPHVDHDQIYYDEDLPPDLSQLQRPTSSASTKSKPAPNRQPTSFPSISSAELPPPAETPAAPLHISSPTQHHPDYGYYQEPRKPSSIPLRLRPMSTHPTLSTQSQQASKKIAQSPPNQHRSSPVLNIRPDNYHNNQLPQPTQQHPKERYCVIDNGIGLPVIMKVPIISNNDIDDCFIDYPGKYD